MFKQIYFWLIVIVIIVTCFLQWIFCCRGLYLTKSDDIVAVETKTLQEEKLPGLDFIISDATGDFSLKSNDNFNFKKSSFDYEKPISLDVESQIGKLKDYIIANKGKSLSIRGLYMSDEQNTSMYPNLGIARANVVKNYFVGKGIPANIINLFGDVNDNVPVDSNNILRGPVYFKIENVKVDNEVEEMSKLLAEIKSNPLVLNFGYKEFEMEMSDKQREKVVKIAKYLDKVSDAKCLVVGFSDDKGEAKDNEVLAQKRADFTKECLVKNAISDSRIETKSEGERKPVASNKTDAGRAKNRRTEITIK